MLPGGSVGRTRQVHSSLTDKPFPACLLYHAEFDVTGAIFNAPSCKCTPSIATGSTNDASCLAVLSSTESNVQYSLFTHAGSWKVCQANSNSYIWCSPRSPFLPDPEVLHRGGDCHWRGTVPLSGQQDYSARQRQAMETISLCRDWRAPGGEVEGCAEW